MSGTTTKKEEIATPWHQKPVVFLGAIIVLVVVIFMLLNKHNDLSEEMKENESPSAEKTENGKIGDLFFPKNEITKEEN